MTSNTYEALLRDVFDNGVYKDDRTGTGTRSVFGRQIRYKLADGFPLITTKKVSFRSIAYELLWFIKGETNIGWLKENNVTIWNEWANENGELGPVYGYQWRSWPTPDGQHIDQLAKVIDQIKRSPDSRRLIVSAWNVADLDNMALMPCHAFFQFYVSEGKLSCQLYQRSADMFLGVPFNIASYALLTTIVAQLCNLAVGDFIWTGGDVHIYTNHFAQVEEQLSRQPMPLPTLQIQGHPPTIDDFSYDNFVLKDYQSHGRLVGPVAV